MSQGHGFLACYAHLILLKRKPYLDNEKVKKREKKEEILVHIYSPFRGSLLDAQNMI